MASQLQPVDRRSVLKTSALAFLGLTLPSLGYSSISNTNTTMCAKIPEHFPNIDPALIAEVVGKSHADLDRVKELVNVRPELARSVWEWRFGDFESAIGAASHVGRRDIAQFLISKGARPTLYTFAMLGNYETVKAMIDFSPGIQMSSGPHGISLLDHAYAGRRMQGDMTSKEIENLEKTIAYLETLGNANGDTYIDVPSEEQQKYLGDYRYGSGEP